MPSTKDIKVTTTKESGEKVEVLLTVDVPENFTEAASEDFYGGENEASKALQGDWSTRVANAVRAAVREAGEGTDHDVLARQIADSYKPGRRGGFGKLDAGELEQFDSVEDLIAHLRATGRVSAGAAS